MKNPVQMTAAELSKGDVLVDCFGQPIAVLKTQPTERAILDDKVVAFTVRMMKETDREKVGNEVQHLWPSSMYANVRKPLRMASDDHRYPVLFVVETKRGPEEVSWYETKGGRLRAETWTKEVAEELAAKIHIAEVIDAPSFLSETPEPQVKVKPMGNDTWSVFVRSALDVRHGTRGGYVRGLHGTNYAKINNVVSSSR
jgi:hypothetical protein